MAGSTMNRQTAISPFPLFKLVTIIVLSLMLIALIFYTCDIAAISIEQRQLKHLTHDLANKIDTFLLDYFTDSATELAKSQVVIDACTNRTLPENEQLLSVLNASRTVLGVSFVYVMDSNGNVIGSSVDEKGFSLAGHNYAFRPYFTRSMAGAASQFPAIGITTMTKGVYFSAPIYADSSKLPCGALVIKTKPHSTDNFFHKIQGTIETLLLSPDGVVFSASRPDWIFSLATPITDEQAIRLKQSRQFMGQELPVLPFDISKTIIHYDDIRAVTASDSLQITGWRVVTIGHTSFPLVIALTISSLIVILLGLAVSNVVHAHREQTLQERIRLGMIHNTEVEAERRKTQQELEIIFSTILVGIALVRDNRLVQVNQRLCDMLGYSMHEIAKSNVRNFFISKEAFRQFIRNHYQTLPHSVVEQVECYLQKKDGTFIPCMISGKTLQPTDPSRGSVWVIEDLSKRKEIEKALDAAREQAESANVAKSAFLANMSHEIRTPMNGIIGLTKLVRQGVQKEDLQNHLDLILRAAHRLLSIINDILDFSKLEAGRYEVQCSSFDPRETMTEILTPFQVLADVKNIDLVWSVDTAVPGTIYTDQNKMMQIITNLVDNAIKFTNEGEVRIAVSFRKRYPPSSRYLFIEVGDTGIGIPREHYDSIFQAFSQVDSSFSRGTGGSGLGLSITKGLVHMLGGDLWFDSEQGRGSRFYFTLPISEPDEKIEGEFVTNKEREQDDVQQEKAGKQILVCEDEYINTVLICTLLEDAGYQVSVAANGFEAVRKWKKKKFNCIIMDIQMPGMDGFEAARRIRNMETDGGHTPIIAMTANATEADRKACLQAGMDYYLPKPIDGQEVLDLIQQCIKKP